MKVANHLDADRLVNVGVADIKYEADVRENGDRLRIILVSGEDVAERSVSGIVREVSSHMVTP